MIDEVRVRESEMSHCERYLHRYNLRPSLSTLDPRLEETIEDSNSINEKTISWSEYLPRVAHGLYLSIRNSMYKPKQ